MTLSIYNKNCYGLEEIKDESVDCVVTDPPYGISFASWDKSLPDKKIWGDCFRVLKPGSFALIFSSIRLLHRLTCHVEESGFLIRDVLMWGFLNGMPKSRDVALDIDKELGVQSEIVGEYKYVQGYRKDNPESYKAAKERKAPASEVGKKYKGAGLGIKPAYEPILLVQKPLEGDLTVAQNVIKHGVGCLNLEETRIPYGDGDEKVGHNPHPLGRVSSNIIRCEEFEDGYDKFFLVPKVRQHKDDFNDHPTLKPIDLVNHLVKLISFNGQVVLDPFMGSGTTGVASIETERDFIGYEIDESYFKIAQRRIGNTK